MQNDDPINPAPAGLRVSLGIARALAMEPKVLRFLYERQRRAQQMESTLPTDSTPRARRKVLCGGR